MPSSSTQWLDWWLIAHNQQIHIQLANRLLSHRTRHLNTQKKCACCECRQRERNGIYDCIFNQFDIYVFFICSLHALCNGAAEAVGTWYVDLCCSYSAMNKTLRTSIDNASCSRSSARVDQPSVLRQYAHYANGAVSCVRRHIRKKAKENKRRNEEELLLSIWYFDTHSRANQTLS